MSNKNETIKIERQTIIRGLAKLARATGYTHSHLSRVLSGKRAPSAALARDLAVCGIEIAYKEKAYKNDKE